MTQRPFIWQMIKEAIETLGGKATYTQIKEYISSHFGEVNESTINAQIIVCTVNQPSRIHYPENRKPRLANSRYDFLYSVARGEVELYDPEKHGAWQVRKNEYGKLEVAQVGLEELPETNEEETENQEEMLFPIESQLRDFLAKNIEKIAIKGERLKLYVDEHGRDGVEYPTDVGPIDILAVDDAGNLYVFELKLSRGPDRASGQLLRYMGWTRAKLAMGKEVKGIIVAKSIDEKLRLAASVVPQVHLFEYELGFKISHIS